MNYKGLIAACDFDSACYAAGMANDIKEMEFGLAQYIKKIQNILQPSKTVGFVEAIENKFIFRNWVAVNKRYKSNRADRVAPPFKNEAKMLSRSKYGFQFCTVYESEDAISCVANDVGIWNCVKCGCDGDLLTCPGLFFNYFGTKWKLPYFTEIDEYVIMVDEEQAQRNFYTQLCQGDSQDAIDAVRGIGPKAAEKIVKDCPLEELPKAVGKLYKEKGYSYHYMIEMARLLKILERRDELCTPLTPEEWGAL